ncbi:MAG: amino acid adenylation domain-containing protein [Gammaproteobacteria bacterium]|nr:amino acid adenylation domain-containing protein [Gammaproteobacteria bacterium]
MSAAELLGQLSKLGVRLRVEDGELRVSAPQGVLTAELHEQLKDSKAELLELLLVADASQNAVEINIPHADRSQTIPLSFAQQRIWFLEEFEGGSSIYNIPWAMRIKGQFNADALQSSLGKLIARHESLRTVFLKTEAEPEQKILNSMDLVVEKVSMPGADDAAVRMQLEEWSGEPFPLAQGPLLRVRLVELAEDDHVLMMVMHHIISDAWSLDLLQTELFSIYFAECAGETVELPELPLQFADYACWQRDYLQGAELERQLKYWTDKLCGAPPILELPADRPRPSEQSYRGARMRRLLSVDLRESLKALARSNNATLFMVLLAAFDVLLARYSGQNDIVVGSPIAGRQQTDLEGLIGLFLNTLVMRTDLSANPSYSELLKQVQTTALDAYAHQELPFDKLVDALQPARDMSYSPVFQMQFMLQNAPASADPVQGLELTGLEFEYGTAKFDLTLAMGETHDGLMAEIEYSIDLFDAITIERMLEQFERLLHGIVANPTVKINELPLVGSDDKQLFASWNDTNVDYPSDATLQTLLEQQAEASPDALAVIFEHEQLTYAEFNSQVNQLAHWLISKGVTPDTMVGVYMERSVEMVVALHAIIKAGGAYVPLDPDYPEQRLVHMFEDADIGLLLTQSALVEQLPGHEAEVLCVESAIKVLAKQPDSNPPQQAQPDNLAYVIFTSGSTGRPKGVMNEHHGIVNRLLWMQSEYGLGPDDKVLQKTPYSFDVSVWEFFWPLISGATLVMARPDGHKDSTYLTDIIQEHGVTTMHFVPSMLQVFLQDSHAGNCSSLKRVICSGEALPHELQTRFFETLGTAELHNLYGPTEAAIDVTYWACDRDSTDTSVPIGRPVANTRIHVVEPNGQMAPVGVAGELWIAGEQVARGYINRPELTAERFIVDPFSSTSDARIYRSGDLVRWRNDGAIEFLGRIDHQVKLRGFRIELGEIEASLDALPGVKQSLVMLHEDVAGNKRLVAYVTAADGNAADIPQLRDALKQQLPEYMVPAVFVPLQEFPLLANGKVDRKALPEPEGRRDVADEYIPAGTDHERVLAQIWSDLLHIERVGIHDNFFELGGDSILSIQIIARAAKAGLHLTPKQVFKHQTIAELADVAGSVVVVAAEQGLVTGSFPLIPVQHWFFEQSSVDKQYFNQSTLLDHEGRLDADLLESVFQAIVRQHDALRSSFKFVDSQWLQTIGEPQARSIHAHVDLHELSPADQDQRMYEEAMRLQASFDLNAGLLIKTIGFELGSNRPDRLLIVIHHLVVDGVSWRILLEDIESAYAAISQNKQPELPAKSSSFKAWSEQLQHYASTDRAKSELSYWQQQSWPECTLPVDHADGENLVDSARTVTVSLDEQTTRQLLQEAPQAYRTQVNDLLLTALGSAVSDWTGQGAVLIDMEGHGRDEEIDLDVSRTVGWFTTIYPVSINVAPNATASDRIKSIKEQLRALPANGFAFGLLRYLHHSAEVHDVFARLPAAPILFNYLGQFDQTFSQDSAFVPAAGQTGPDQALTRQRSHLIDINGSVFDGKLQMGFSYSENLHESATIERIANAFIHELASLVEHCVEPGNSGFTPSDFPLVQLDQFAVDALLTECPDLEDIYPVTPMQHGMLFHSAFAGDDADHTSQVYLTQVIWNLEGNLNPGAFEKAWQTVVARHTSLRSSFLQSGLDEPLTIVHKQVEIPLQFLDWSHLGSADQEQQLELWLVEDQKRGYELSSAPLMRLLLVQFGEQDFRFVWSHHHIVIDGWSIPVVLDELFQAYEAALQSKQLTLSPARSYRDYIAWLQDQDKEEARQFWQETLQGFAAPTPLPAASKEFPGTDNASSYAKCFMSLEPAETAQIRQLAKTMRLTANTLVQGIWALLISRYTGEDDVLFGATTSGRPAELKNVESIVGLFLNALPVRIKVQPDVSLQEWMAGIQELQLASRQHEYISLVDVQGWSSVPQGSALFNSVLIFENYPDASSLWSDRNTLRVTDMQSRGWTSLPLAAAVSISEQLVLRLSYDTGCYTAAAIEQLLEQFRQMLHRVVAATDLQVADLLRLEDTSLKITAQTGPSNVSQPFQELTTSSSLASCFEQQVQLTPEACVVLSDSESWSYAELNVRANKVAHELIASGFEPGERVGLLLGQNAPMLAGMLGALKAGLTYVPLDPKAPVSRLQKIFAEAELAVIVSDAQRQSLAGELVRNAAVALTIVLADQPAESDAANPELLIDQDSLAYILFTSGSTGTPKGVTQTHRNALHHIRTYSDAMHINSDDRLSLFAPYGYDAAVMDIYGALLNGACLCPVDIREQVSAADIRQQLAEQQVTVFHSTPTVFRFLFEQPAAEELTAIRIVVLGGEEARLTDLNLFQDRFGTDVIFSNLMGATEYSIAMVCFADHETQVVGAKLPLGLPVDGANVELVVPEGESAVLHGELCIRSEYTSPGYWGDADLTASTFIPVPGSDEKNYRTGDICRYLPDGQIVFVGRRDQQLKIRGNRVEPGEVEAALAGYSTVEQCVVILRKDQPDEERLVAYFVSAEQMSPDGSTLRHYLQGLLPEYMIPAAFVELDAIPLTPNGKLDRLALPLPEIQYDEKRYVAPRTPTEEILAGLWADVLGVDRVGVHDDFFLLGGHSLLATKLISRIRDALNIEPGIGMLFKYPAVADFAVSLDGAEAGVSNIVPVPHKDGAPLSFAQQRLWFLDQLEGDNPAYHMFAPVRMTGALRLDAIQSAVNDLVARHETLRSTFIDRKGEALQLIAEHLDVPVEVLEMPGADDQLVRSTLIELVNEPYDLAQGPLFKVRLLHVSDDSYVFVILIHHIIADVWSMEVMYRDFLSFYRAHCGLESESLPDLPIQYADYAFWQQQLLSGAESQRQLQYWCDQLAGIPAVIELPIDRPRPLQRSFEGGAVNRFLPAKLNDSLKRIGHQQGATLFMVLQAVFDILLARYSRETDVVIGTPVTGRKQSSLEGLIGFFLNMLVLRADVSGDPTFIEFLRQIKANTLDAYAHQDLPFEQLVTELQPVRDTSHSPLFQVMFTVVTQAASPGELPDLQLEMVEVDFQTAKFDLFMSLTSQPDGLNVHLEYSKDIFDAVTIERMLDHFVMLLEGVAAHPNVHIAELPLLQEQERQQLLVDWNDTGFDYPRDTTLVDLFAEQVALVPEAVALECGGTSLSYVELDRRANQLAHRLRESGVGPDVLVGLCLERSIEMMVGLLGVHKAGGAYLPLDPAYPEDRIAYMLEDSGAPVVITQTSLVESIPAATAELICVDALGPLNVSDDKAPVNTGMQADNLAYVIYTSGSTGKPKGVQLEHRSVVNFLNSMASTPGLTGADRLLAVTTLSFDISVLELLLPLSVGATVVLATREQAADGFELKALLEDAAISVMQATPATWRMLLQTGWQGSKSLTVLCGGEALDRELAEQLHAATSGVWNMYGPTETTIWSSCHRFDPAEPVISVGRPIYNTSMYILDEQLQPVPVGVAGELFIGGEGLARGYRDRPDLTADRFVADTFVSVSGGRMYRTGDLAKFIPDGSIQVLGRTDFQVKLRGFRIELGEIEAAVRDCDSVDQAVLLLREDLPGDQRLVCYLTSAEPDLEVNSLREQLYASLPQYMVPAAFMQLDELPLTPNGKIDRKALPAPEWESGDNYVAPGTPTEEALAEIWADILQLDKVGINDNFFVLGGHSLLATQLVARIRNTLNAELPLMYIFDYASVASLAVAVDAFSLAAGAAPLNLEGEDMEDISI